MITTKMELNVCLKQESIRYIKYNWRERIITWFSYDKDIPLWNYQKLLRKTEYHYNNRKSGILHRVMYIYYRRKKNKLGTILSIEMWENSFDIGLRIHHAGNIVVNGNARIGKNCVLHGSNCIGNDGKSLTAPMIGDNVVIGVGAKIIGGITIADNIKIAAGAVVISSFMEPGITIAGIPAKRVK